jgi:hypothetical protein
MQPARHVHAQQRTRSPGYRHGRNVPRSGHRRWPAERPYAGGKRKVGRFHPAPNISSLAKLPTQNSIKMDLLGRAAQRMEAAVLEAQPRARDEIAHCARYDRFSCLRLRCNARCDMHSDPGDIIALQLDLAGVQPAPHRDPERPHQIANRGGTAHPSRRAVAGRHKSAPRGARGDKILRVRTRASLADEVIE